MNHTRGESVDPDIVLSPLGRHAPGQMRHTGFGHAIGDVVPGKYIPDDHPIYRSDVDDPPPMAPGDHVLGDPFTKVEET